MSGRLMSRGRAVVVTVPKRAVFTEEGRLHP